MYKYIFLAFYILVSATGLVLIKSGGEKLILSINSGIFNIQISTRMLLGMLFYICSFFMFIYIMPKFKLTYIYPITAGILYIIIAFAGIFVLKETINRWQYIGMAFILLGVIAMNINKAG